MKKRDLVLDFTSLLDIIMIILFVVISGMGQASLDAQKEAQEQMEENYAALQKELEQLTKENNLYKKEDADKALLYESLMEHAKKITLICIPSINSDKADGNEVEIKIYSDETSEEQEETDAVIFTHNFELTREERLLKNAEAQSDMYHALENIIREGGPELVFITVEYIYEDKNFSQTDLNNIMGAVDDIERNYPVKCYIDKLKR